MKGDFVSPYPELKLRSQDNLLQLVRRTASFLEILDEMGECESLYSPEAMALAAECRDKLQGVRQAALNELDQLEREEAALRAVFERIGCKDLGDIFLGPSSVNLQ